MSNIYSVSSFFYGVDNVELTTITGITSKIMLGSSRQVTGHTVRAKLGLVRLIFFQSTKTTSVSEVQFFHLPPQFIFLNDSLCHNRQLFQLLTSYLAESETSSGCITELLLRDLYQQDITCTSVYPSSGYYLFLPYYNLLLYFLLGLTSNKLRPNKFISVLFRI